MLGIKGKRYDMKKLADSGQFDLTVVHRFYYNPQEYFDDLAEFAATHRSPLRNYTPAFVINSEDERQVFIRECFEARASYMKLGLIGVLHEISVMEDAVQQNMLKEFSDGQIKFLADLEICIETIKDAETRWVIGK